MLGIRGIALKKAHKDVRPALADDGASHAQRIVKELYVRYEKQMQRWIDYRNLFIFLAFVALFLGVLYCQRNADVAYQVTSTIEAVVLPPNTVFQDPNEIYSWLDGIMTVVWQDPVCGDGICEAPFEFPSYSSFGCRADCGLMQDVLNLTIVQIDIYYDFTHPVGSLPASDLMQQAQWNLCPVQTIYNNSCYYASAQTFSSITGQLHATLNDVPDGYWDLVMTNDIFDKTWGAVRITDLVSAAGYYDKVYIAYVAALAQQNYELSLLQSAESIGALPLLTYVNETLQTSNGTTIVETGSGTMLAWKFEIQQLAAAPCLCSSFVIASNSTATWSVNDTLVEPFNNTADAANPSILFAKTAAQYVAGSYCTGNNAPVTPMLLEYYNQSSNGSLYQWPTTVPTGMNYTTINITVAASNMTSWCELYMNKLLTWRSNMTLTMQQLLVDKRLGNQVTTGKIAYSNAVNADMYNFLVAQYPELVNPVYSNPVGTNPANPISSTISYLINYYLDGPYLYTRPKPAANNLRYSTVYVANISLLDLSQRSAARITEVQFSQTNTSSIVLPAYSALYPQITIAEMYSLFVGANSNSTNTSLPNSNSTELGELRTDYNLVTWQGNTTAYLQCDLPARDPTYIGKCVDMNQTCTATTSDTVPFSCTYLSSGAAVSGNMASATYRSDCEGPCTRQLDCAALCECYDTCSTDQTCQCTACTNLNYNAAADEQFIQISAYATSTYTIAPLSAPSRRMRSLMTVAPPSTDVLLNEVLHEVSQVQSEQQTISGQMTALQSQIDSANTLAQEQASDTSLIDLINAGRADIATGQAAIQSQLNTIIGLENQALTLANQAATALANLNSLAQSMQTQLAALETAVQSQITAIKTALSQNVITVSQALALWKVTRRDQAATNKAVELSNVPCTTVPTVNYDFILNTTGTDTINATRERDIGLTNRVIGGMLVNLWRTNDTTCPSSKFSQIQNVCTGPISTSSYGIDPVFKSGTDVYNPSYDTGTNNTLVVGFYNCSLLNNPTYDVYNTVENKTVNYPPYCAQLYNPQNLPYAFHHFPLSGKEQGFPVWFDINLSQEEIQNWYTWVSEGLYIDANTQGLTVDMITYNAPLRMFAYFFCSFDFGNGGSISAQYSVYTVQVELYNGEADEVRFAFEIILSVAIACLLLYQGYGMYKVHVKCGNFLHYFKSAWNYIDLLSDSLLATCMIMWWIWVAQYANQFSIDLRYNVYASLNPSANFLNLNDNGAELTAAWSAFESLTQLINLLNWYYALNGINILLLIARILKLMDFQPRLGVVTRSLWLAGPDLIHFAIVAGMVFVGYAMMAHLIFGNAIPEFSSFGNSINTCFEMLLGNIDVYTELQALGGLQSVAGALFFWSYELLVFMVLLNFLLAIIVDAFGKVKEKTDETIGIHTELFQLLRDKWRGMTGRLTSHYISDEKLGQLLKQWAGEDGEKDEAEQLEDAKKFLTVLNEELDEETLREVLNECLRDAPEQEEEPLKPEQPEKKKFFWQRMVDKSKPKRVATTPEEIALAAKYIVDRFGGFKDDGDGEIAVVPGAPAEKEAGEETKKGDDFGGPSNEQVLEQERDQLAQALERLADVQRELAEGQRSLMAGQKQLAEQQAKLVTLMNEGQAPP